MKDLPRRLISALIAAAASLTLIQWGWGLGLLVAGATIGLALEMRNLCTIIQPRYQQGHTVIHTLMTIFVLYYILHHIFPASFPNTALSEVLPGGFIIYIIFILMMLTGSHVIAKNLPILSLFYPYMGIIALIELSFVGESYSALPIIFLLLSVWSADASAYLAGNLIGGRKLAPHISPNKTISGWLGALLGIAVLTLLFNRLFQEFTLLQILLWIPGIWLMSTMGDLFESVIKRSAGVKDSGVFLPGHGGFLDRLDSLIFAAPMAFYIISLV